jgi:hypothetical protein
MGGVRGTQSRMISLGEEVVYMVVRKVSGESLRKGMSK